MSYLYQYLKCMVDFYVVVGAGGIVGQQVMARLKLLGKSVQVLPTQAILNGTLTEVEAMVLDVIKSAIVSQRDSIRIGIIFAHRVRIIDLLEALRCELRITRDLIYTFAANCSEVRAVILGSITGTVVHRHSSEAYHYTKDLQKSCVRYSVIYDNVYMNLLELSWFEKYLPSQATKEYLDASYCAKQIVGERNFVNISDITDFSVALMESDRPPRGQIIAYDGGYSLLQR